jgi:hypothetical protein
MIVVTGWESKPIAAKFLAAAVDVEQNRKSMTMSYTPELSLC